MQQFTESLDTCVLSNILTVMRYYTDSPVLILSSEGYTVVCSVPDVTDGTSGGCGE